jgi:hypothetical protein
MHRFIVNNQRKFINQVSLTLLYDRFLKKRKITQLDDSGDQSEGDRKAKKQKIEAEEPLEARDVLKVATESIPTRTINVKEV